MKTLNIKMTSVISIVALSALATPVFAADFSNLDANADGQVNFAEYKKVALSEGKTVTLAAQEFMRMAQGDAILTQDEFFLATALIDEPYALQSFLPSESVAYTTEDTRESSDPQTVVTSPPVEEAPVESSDALTLDTPDVKPAPTPIIVEKPVDVIPVIESDVETTNDMMDVTPAEEGALDLPDTEVTVDPKTSPDIEESEDLIDEMDIESGEIY